MIPFIWHSGKGKNCRERKQWLPGAELQRALGLMEMFYTLIVVIVTRLYIFIETNKTAH